jgi:antitoxin HicB
MSREFSYPVTLTPDETDGGFVVTFEDVPEAITQGDTREDALLEAADALDEAIAVRIKLGLDIPQPSLADDRPLVPAPALTAAKVALHFALRASSGLSKSELAEQLLSNGE